MGKKLTVSLAKIIFIFLLAVGLGVGRFYEHRTAAWFASSVTSASSNISTGDWTRPTSAITSTEELVNSSDFSVDYNAEDNAIDYVELWYSFNFGDWRLFGNDTPHSPGSFAFTSPEGDGLYRFITVAVDQSGSVEDENGNGVDDNLELDEVALYLDTNLYQVQVDTEAPYTTLSLGEFGDDGDGENRFAVNEQMGNGNFEDSGDPEKGWTFGGDGDHQAVDDAALAGEMAEVKAGDKSGLVGWLTAPAGDGQDYAYQTVFLPASPSSLSFWYRVVSDDTVDYDWFTAKIIDDSNPSQEEMILRTGSDEAGGWSGDSDWREVTHPLTPWLGQTVRVWFGVTNYDEPGFPAKTFALVDDVRITNLDNFVTTGKEIEINAGDPGSGVDTTYYQVNSGGWQESFGGLDLSSEGVGTGQTASVSYYSVDLAGNPEATSTAMFKTDDGKSYFGVVLNRISPRPAGSDQGLGGSPLDGEWVELWNNGQTDVDIDGWVLWESDGGYLPINAGNSDNNSDLGDGGETVVPAGGGLRVYRNGDGDFALNDAGDTVELWTDYEGSGGLKKDSFAYGAVLTDDKVWRRDPDGTGTWADPLGEGPAADLVLTGKNTAKLTLGNLNKDEGGISVELIYYSLGKQKGVFVEFDQADIAEGEARQEVFFGSCSAGGSCFYDHIDDDKVLAKVKTAGRPDFVLEKEFRL